MARPLWLTVATDAGVDVIDVVTTWLIASLGIQGVTFGSLITQKSVIVLVVALAIWLQSWTRNYRKTRDPDPVPPTDLAALGARLDRVEARLPAPGVVTRSA